MCVAMVCGSLHWLGDSVPLIAHEALRVPRPSPLRGRGSPLPVKRQHGAPCTAGSSCASTRRCTLASRRTRFRPSGPRGKHSFWIFLEQKKIYIAVLQIAKTEQSTDLRKGMKMRTLFCRFRGCFAGCMGAQIVEMNILHRKSIAMAYVSKYRFRCSNGRMCHLLSFVDLQNRSSGI